MRVAEVLVLAALACVLASCATEPVVRASDIAPKTRVRISTLQFEDIAPKAIASEQLLICGDSTAVYVQEIAFASENMEGAMVCLSDYDWEQARPTARAMVDSICYSYSPYDYRIKDLELLIYLHSEINRYMLPGVSRSSPCPYLSVNVYNPTASAYGDAAVRIVYNTQ